MNLFILFDDPVLAAQAHCDKHVIKMILETCQMLYTAHWTTEYPPIIVKQQRFLLPPDSFKDAPKKKNSEVRGYASAHINHPCTKWIRESLENYMFACELGLALAEEYKYRWQTTREHSCQKHVQWLKEHPPRLPSIGITPFAVAMDEKYRISCDPIECYRNFYATSKKERGLLVYTRREMPSFIMK
jgi:hypothetical protein